ncbi:DUF4349 domain-containing protein [Streptomyces sp. NPDC052052]|uniref:DUF4349 domain-containing protein n=1 Tax=Streptomyces sp. NPDC052052 TaxID=3154756 RepID=UPI00343B1330
MQTDRHRSRSSGRRSRTILAAGLLAGLLTLSGCSGASDSDAGDSKSAVRAGSGAQGAAASGAEKSAQDTDSSSATAKKSVSLPAATHVIRTASLSVEVKSVPKAVAAARSVAERAGGLVASEETERIDDSHQVSRLELRVPQGEYAAALRELAGTGKLLSRTSSAKDVTDQVVDVASRIATQRASVARVRTLMNRAEKITDVVALEGELSSRQATLESLLARQDSLKDRTTLATITLDLTEPEAATESDDDPGFLDALGGGWDAFVTMLRWLTMAVGAAAPFLASAAVLLLLWRLLRSRLPGRRAPRVPEPSESSSPTPAS